MTKAEQVRALLAELSLDERARFYLLSRERRDRCIEQMIDRKRRAEAQVKADATGKAVVCNGRLFEPTVRMERRL
jgi:hypothetical protein